MNVRQGTKITRHNIPTEYLINPIIDNFPKIDILKNIIDELKTIKSFNNANQAMLFLEPYFNKLTDDQINEVVNNSIKNSQIYQAFLCRDQYLPNFIQINKEKIQDDQLEELSKLIIN